MTLTRTRPYHSLRAATGLAVVLVLGGSPGLSARAEAAAPTATVVPSAGLVDGQRVTIRASGFHPYTPVQVLACEGTAEKPPLDSRACEGVTLDSTGYTDAGGRYLNEPGDPSGDTVGYRVAVLPSEIFKTVSIACGPHDPCVLYVGEEFNDFSKPHIFVPIAFAGGGAPAAAGARSADVGNHSGGGSGGGGPAVVPGIAAVVGLAVAFRWRRHARRPRVTASPAG